MPNMSIGSVTFIQNPAKMTAVKKDRIIGYVKTYGSTTDPRLAIFSWGATIVGKRIDMNWPAMLSTEFAALQALIEADATVVFNPQLGDSKTYNVELLDLEGVYHMYSTSGAGIYRTDVVLSFIIVSQV